jgi:hypothetical protein
MMVGGGQVVSGFSKRRLVHIGKHDGRARLRERLGRRQAHPGTASGDERDLSSKVVAGVHARLLDLAGAGRPGAAYSSSVTWRP